MAATQPQPSLLDEDEAMDSREQEALDALEQGISEELELLLCPADVANDGSGGGVTDVQGAIEEDVPDEATVAAVVAGVVDAIASVGEADDDLAPQAGEEHGASAGSVVPPPPPAEELWLQLGPTTALGYVYDATPRSVLRIQGGSQRTA